MNGFGFQVAAKKFRVPDRGKGAVLRFELWILSGGALGQLIVFS